MTTPLRTPPPPAPPRHPPPPPAPARHQLRRAGVARHQHPHIPVRPQLRAAHGHLWHGAADGGRAAGAAVVVLCRVGAGGRGSQLPGGQGAGRTLAHGAFFQRAQQRRQAASAMVSGRQPLVGPWELKWLPCAPPPSPLPLFRPGLPIHKPDISHPLGLLHHSVRHSALFLRPRQPLSMPALHRRGAVRLRARSACGVRGAQQHRRGGPPFGGRPGGGWRPPLQRQQRHAGTQGTHC
jgi:hypothetical protein